MKKTKFLFTLLMAIVMMAMSPMKSWAGEPVLVTEDNYSTLGLTSSYVGYYAIADADGLVWMADKVENDNANFVGMKVVLTADIDLSGIAAWTPIGTSNTKFMGTFDGQGHSITGMNIPNYTASCQGLFAWVEGTSTKHAVLKNFSLSGIMTSSTEGPDYIGGVVGRCADYVDMIDIINNVSITIAPGVKQNHMGGVAGWCKATKMTRCVNNGNINAGATSDCIAGVMGYATTTCKLTDCLNTGNIISTADEAYVSGILGYVNNANFQGVHNCLNTGTITGGSANTYAGAIFGWSRQDAAIKSANNYYLNTSAAKGVGENAPSNNVFASNLTSVTAEQLASGEVCYLLNGDQSNIVWYQTLSEDACPSLNDAHAIVINYSKLCDSNGAWTGKYVTTGSYSNTVNTVIDDEQCKQYIEDKAVLSGSTLTFYRDYILHDGTTYALNVDNKTPGWYNDKSSITSVVFSESFDSSRPVTCALWFSGCINLSSIAGIEYLHTDDATSMYAMFYNCSALTSLDVSHFNTANVTSMYAMFYNCSALTSLDLSNFNTANVTSMNSMFWKCSKLATLDLGNFNTANLTSMYYMFNECESLTALDLSHFNTANVTNMQRLFYGCKKLATLDVSHFNTTNITNMEIMFKGCESLTSLDLGSFNTANVTTMNSMFYGCTKLKSLNLSSFNTENVSNMGLMFNNCSGLTTLDLSHFNTANVTTMNSMFYNCLALKSLDLNNFNTEKVVTMSHMFYNCWSLTTLDLSNFNTEKVKSVDDMFYGCIKLTTLTLGNFDMRVVTNSSYMFNPTLTTLILKSMPYMQDGTFNTWFADKTVNYVLDDNSVVYTGTPNYLPVATSEPTYTRTGINNQWGTVVVPFEVGNGDDYDLYTLTSVTNDEIALTKLNGTLPAGTPALIRLHDGLAGDYNLTITASDNAVDATRPLTGPEVGGVTLTGCYAAKDITEEQGYILSGDKFLNVQTAKGSGSVECAPFSAYLAGTVGSGADQLSIVIDNNTTAVEAIGAITSDDAEYYDISGRRINSLHKGMNIVKLSNGKTVKVNIK